MSDRQSGFSLIELLVVLVIFLIVTGSVFALLDAAQLRYRTEQEFLESFQNARVGIDQLVREIHSAGFPAPYTYPGNTVVPPTYPGAWPTWTDPSTAAPDLQRRFAISFVGAPNQNCVINVDCAVPNASNLTVELDMDPENPNCLTQVEIVDYQLVPDADGVTSTLMRRVSSKAPVVDPPNCMPNPGAFVPFVENVLPNPGGVPLFQYTCDPDFADIGGNCNPEYIRDVIITLTVRSARPDMRTRQFRQITLEAAVRRMNPYQ